MIFLHVKMFKTFLYDFLKFFSIYDSVVMSRFIEFWINNNSFNNLRAKFSNTTVFPSPKNYFYIRNLKIWLNTAEITS